MATASGGEVRKDFCLHFGIVEFEHIYVLREGSSMEEEAEGSGMRGIISVVGPK